MKRSIYYKGISIILMVAFMFAIIPFNTFIVNAGGYYGVSFYEIRSNDGFIYPNVEESMKTFISNQMKVAVLIVNNYSPEGVNLVVNNYYAPLTQEQISIIEQSNADVANVWYTSDICINWENFDNIEYGKSLYEVCTTGFNTYNGSGQFEKINIQSMEELYLYIFGSWTMDNGTPLKTYDIIKYGVDYTMQTEFTEIGKLYAQKSNGDFEGLINTICEDYIIELEKGTSQFNVTVNAGEVQDIGLLKNLGTAVIVEGNSYNAGEVITLSAIDGKIYTFESFNGGNNDKLNLTVKIVDNGGTGNEDGNTGDDGTTNWDFIVPVTHQKTVPSGYTGIYTSQDLNNIRNNLSGKYILMNDIDLSSWGNWTPIGDTTLYEDEEGFEGIFDGNGYIIENITIDMPLIANHLVGLFSSTKNSVIKNLGLTNLKIITTHYGNFYSQYVGGIVGNITSSVIENCYVSGNINLNNISSSTYVGIGGIIGRAGNNSKITYCYSNTSINMNYGSSLNIGGIVGEAFNIDIERCFNIGKLQATSFTNSGYSSYTYCGGIIGNIENSNITDCYNSGEVTAIGKNTGQMVNKGSYWEASWAYSGGIVGYLDATLLKNSYNIGSINAMAYSWATLQNPQLEPNFAFRYGLIGKSHGDILNCYSLTSNYNGGSTGSSGLILTTTQMKQKSSFVGFDFGTIWKINPNINNGYPYLLAIPSEVGTENPSEHTIVSWFENSFNCTIDKETIISATFTSDMLVAENDSILSFSCSDNTAVQLVDLSVLRDTWDNKLGTVIVTFIPKKVGIYTITLTTIDGASTQATLVINDKDFKKKAGEFIKLNCTFKYSPIINGNEYYLYEAKGKEIVYNSISGFSFISINSDIEYLLDKNYSLVDDDEILIKGAFINVTNNTLVKNGNVNYSVSGLQKDLDTINSIESNYYDAVLRASIADISYNAYQLIWNMAECVSYAIIGDIPNAIVVTGKWVVDVTADIIYNAKTEGLTTADLLRGYREHWRDLTKNCYNYSISMLENNRSWDNGYIRRYEDLVNLFETKYLTEIYDYCMLLDSKYLARKVNTLTIKSVCEEIIEKATDILDFTKFDDFIDILEIGVNGVYHITTVTSTVTDPDIKKFDEFSKNKIEALKNLVYDLSLVDTFGNRDLLKPRINLNQAVVASCPVDITVYNSSNNVIGKITNNIVDKSIGFDSNNPLVLFVNGESKILMFPKEQNYRLEIVATDDGIMTYWERCIGTNGKEISNTSIYNIPLEVGKVFNVNANSSSPDYTHLFSNAQQVSVSINVISNANGNMLGAGEYFIDNQVYLLATPNDGYEFDGWYENNVKISSATVYSFTAKTDRTLEVRFTKIKEISDPDTDKNQNNSNLPDKDNNNYNTPIYSVPVYDNPVYETVEAEQNNSNTDTVDAITATKISELTERQKKSLETALKNSGLQLAGTGIYITVPTKIDESKTPLYVKAEITPNEDYNPNTVSYYRLNSDSTLTPVPTTYNSRKNKIIIYANKIGIYVPLINEIDFTDIKQSDWFYKYVKEAVTLGIVNGRNEKIFDPLTSATYEDTIVMLFRAIGISPNMKNTSDNWGKPYIDKAVTLGIYNSKWRNSDNITREKMAIIVADTLKMLEISEKLDDKEISRILGDFIDEDKISPEAREAIAICIKEGLIKGTNEETPTIEPLREFTRSQMATIAVRLRKFFIDKIKTE